MTAELVQCIEALRAENARLVEEVAYYKGVASLHENNDFARGFLPAELGLYATHCRFAVALWTARGEVIPFHVFLDMNLWRGQAGRNNLRTHISQLRVALGFDTIENVFQRGYRLTPEGMAVMDRLKAQHAEEYRV